MIQIQSMEEAARLYRKVEARIAAEEEELEQRLAKDKRALEQLATIMRSMLNQSGASSMNVPGVAEVKLVPKRTFGCGDWDMFMTWVVQNNKPELFVKRLHEANMQQWIDDHAGAELPPGVNVVTKLDLKVLKAK